MLDRSNLIIKEDATLHRYCNKSNSQVSLIFENLSQTIGCTYLIYMHEDLLSNEKRVYSSSWDWQDLLIGEKLINNCPIFLAAFNALEYRQHGMIFLPWHNAPPANRDQRNVCGIREEHNIANGFGFGGKGNGVRETLAFGGNKSDKSFHMNFIADPSIFNSTLKDMRKAILTQSDPSQKIRVSIDLPSNG